MYCQKCGTEVTDRFCPKCGTEANGAGQESGSAGVFSDVLNRIKDPNSLKLKDLFVNVFKKHSKEETEEIFISGTARTTPPESEISSMWPKPWLFSRIFVLMALTYFILYVIFIHFGNIKVIPGIIFIGSLTAPIALLVFFFEANAPRNISFFNVLKMFFLGGCASLFATLTLFGLVSMTESTYLNAVIVGIVEEIGKLVIVALFIRSLNTKHILNGILIGAAIGAGFAVFESAGYAFEYLLGYNQDVMFEVIHGRGFLAAGGHIIWAAMSGAALCMVKGTRKFEFAMLFKADFLKLFAVPVVLHAIWDMPVTEEISGKFYLGYILLTVVGWLFILVLMDKGLKQISRGEPLPAPSTQGPM